MLQVSLLHASPETHSPNPAKIKIIFKHHVSVQGRTSGDPLAKAKTSSENLSQKGLFCISLAVEVISV